MASDKQTSTDGDAPTRTKMGWAPAHRTRQKDRPRVAERARRLRADPTSSEARLWKALRVLNRHGANFRRQCAVDSYVFDFGDYSAQVLIEVDGVVHRLIDDVALRDAKKDAHAAATGFRLLRFTNDDVWGRLDWVIDTVRAAPSPLRGGSDAQRPGRGARRMERAADEAQRLFAAPSTTTDAPHPGGFAADPPRKGEGSRRLPRGKKR